ncbi:hypothetical protein RB195_012743 [Necator americanus]|uniref:Uncharacterized protein n=1 Tax=Necator americanus TaxID=51031 RepID=A0ABR1DV49_NECAM
MADSRAAGTAASDSNVGGREERGGDGGCDDDHDHDEDDETRIDRSFDDGDDTETLAVRKFSLTILAVAKLDYRQVAILSNGSLQLSA